MIIELVEAVNLKWNSYLPIFQGGSVYFEYDSEWLDAEQTFVIFGGRVDTVKVSHSSTRSLRNGKMPRWF